MIRLLALAALAAILAGGALAADTRPPPTLQELTAPPRLHDVAISPTGRYLAVVRRTGDKDAVSIIDLVSRKQSILAIAPDMEVVDVHWLQWKGDDRLLVAHSSLGETKVIRQGNRVALAVRRDITSLRRDGSDPVSLGAAQLLEPLEDDSVHVLLQGYEAGSVGRWIKAIRVNVETGAREVLDSGTGRTFGWAADRTGKLILRYESVLGGNLQVMGPTESGGWQGLFVIRAKDVRAIPDVEILGASAEPHKVYVALKPEDGQGNTRELRLYDFTTKTMGPRIWSHDHYDFDAVLFDRREGRIAGLCYWADAYRCDFMDDELKRDYSALEAFFGPDRSIELGAASRNGEVRAVYVRGPSEAGSVYVFDRRTGKIDLLGAQRPALHPDRLGPMVRTSWVAGDKTTLSGYLTEPPGKPAGKLPLIVLPHGGPEARDHLNFNAWAQAFATRGYLVFQPNFRGSGGFGGRFAAQGYGQWGLRMQDDVMEGIQALIDSGRVDPARICVVGASYGGYVSLYAGARRADLVKCVVSFAGVSDLVAMQKWERSRNGADSGVYRYWLKSIGDPDKDRERLAATSPITFADAYGPPVLLIHGDRDGIVPIAQSRAMEVALRKAGRPVRLIEVAGEGHSGWEPEQEASALGEMLVFVEKAIGPGWR